MAKTMQGRLEAKLSKEFFEGGWRFRGTQFMRVASAETKEYFVPIHFFCGFMWVKAQIHSEYYGIENSVRMFAGTTAVEDCICWAAQKAIDVFNTVAARVEPYKDGMRKYEEALKGERR